MTTKGQMKPSSSAWTVAGSVSQVKFKSQVNGIPGQREQPTSILTDLIFRRNRSLRKKSSIVGIIMASEQAARTEKLRSSTGNAFQNRLNLT